MYIDASIADLFAGPAQPKLFLDFDGTISQVDVIDAILENFADRRWLETEEEWLSGKIGSRECLTKQFSFVRVGPDELFRFVDRLQIDDGFRSLLTFARRAQSKLHIISDGFEEYISRMLDGSLNNQFDRSRVTISANSLRPVGADRWTIEFPFFEHACVDGCATCKPAVMKLHNPFSAPSIFVGDGLSDRFAALTADVVFAKTRLADYCSQHAIPYRAYNSLADVAECLNNAYDMVVSSIPEGQISWSEAV